MGEPAVIKLLQLALVCLLFSPLAWPVIETYEFDSLELELRYQRFANELRCPKCQNQNLADSNAPIAADLRREVHRLLHEGYGDDEIIEFMVSRYGEFVLYKPPVNKHTIVLWVLPVVALAVGIVVLLVMVRRNRRGQVSASADELHHQASERLRQIDKENKG